MAASVGVDFDQLLEVEPEVVSADAASTAAVTEAAAAADIVAEAADIVADADADAADIVADADAIEADAAADTAESADAAAPGFGIKVRARIFTSPTACSTRQMP